MTKPDFDIEFERLMNNSWSFEKKKDFNTMKDEWFDKIKHITILNWRKIIDIILDKETEFPSFAKIKKEIDSLTKNRVVESKSYKNCKVCNNLGSVSMLLSFEFEWNGDIEIRKIKSKRYDMPGIYYKLKTEGNKDKYYGYTYHCRCEKGEDLHNLRGCKGYQLSPEEFEELKQFAKK